MRTFTVHANASLPKEEARVRLVKEGIAWWALVSPFFWFLYHRMWWEALLVLGASLLLALGGDAAGLGENVVLMAGLIFQALLAVEANDLRRMALARKAYRPVALTQGQNEAEAELRFFSNWQGPLPTADIDTATSAVFDRRGETGTLRSLVTGPSQAVWPKQTTAVKQDLTPISKAPPSHEEDVLGLFPKPQS